MDTKKITLAQYLLRRLKQIGLDDVFAVPGDFVLGFLNEVLKSDIKYVGTCNELNAAYAADGYARMKGIGCAITTFGVGELSAINGIAGAYAENVPVVKIVGVPAVKFYKTQSLLHHTFGDYEAPLKMYQHVTVASTILNSADTAASEIDRVLTTCLRKRQPVYIGVPSDMTLVEINEPETTLKKIEEEASDRSALEEALDEASNFINASKLPILIPGVELIRRDLAKDFEDLVTKSGFPFTTMLLSKGILDEDHPQFIGLYCGNRSRQYVTDRVENSDCVIILGEKLTDFNTGGFTAMFKTKTTIEVYSDRVRISNHFYHNVYIHDFLRGLKNLINHRESKDMNIKPATSGCIHRAHEKFTPDKGKRLTVARFFDRLAHHIEPESIVIAETGMALFAAGETMLPKKAKFIAQTFYGSIGFTVGATLGVCTAVPHVKVYLLVGDGSFQVTCNDLSTMIRSGLNPTVFLLNNDGYTIERVIVDHPYNDIQSWQYHNIPLVFGGKRGLDCYTEDDLETALEEAKQSASLTFIEAHFDRWDCSDSLRKAGRAMAINNRLIDEE